MNTSLKKPKSAPFQTDQRFSSTKTGVVGLQRESMLKNELHYLPELGKSRRRGHQLPDNNFVYGISYEKLDGGVTEALQHWINLAKDTKAREDRYKLVRDFIELNKRALKAGCVTTKQNDQFRSMNDIRRKVLIDNSASQGSIKQNQMQFPADMVFGVPHRPSTPIHDVLEHKYLRDWLKEMEQIEAEKIAVKKEASKAIAGAYHTKSSWLKNAKIQIEEKPLWKMSRFRNIDGAVDSFRTEYQRKAALSANLLDKESRQGVNSFKQGSYTVNKTSLPS